jgi:hypothetical protein
VASLVPLPVPAGEGRVPALSCLQLKKILKENKEIVPVKLLGDFQNRKCAILKIHWKNVRNFFPTYTPDFKFGIFFNN